VNVILLRSAVRPQLSELGEELENVKHHQESDSGKENGRN
jgi:hypothetical protein